MAIEGFSEDWLEHGEIRRQVYRRGSGPGVLIMHELPGLTPEVVRLAEWVADAGFTVFVPCLFGDAGDNYRVGRSMLALASACIRREFYLFAQRSPSPMTAWLRALSRSIYDELGGQGIGAIGMCLTGNFALTLMVDDHVMAPVLSQPSLPLAVSRANRRDLHLSDADLQIVKRKSGAGAGVLGLRFTNDKLCPKERFDRLRDELGSGFEAIEIDSSPGNVHGLSRRSHSVLTHDLVLDSEGHPTLAARDRVLEFLAERLNS